MPGFSCVSHFLQLFILGATKVPEMEREAGCIPGPQHILPLRAVSTGSQCLLKPPCGAQILTLPVFSQLTHLISSPHPLSLTQLGITQELLIPTQTPLSLSSCCSSSSQSAQSAAASFSMELFPQGPADKAAFTTLRCIPLLRAGK